MSDTGAAIKAAHEVQSETLSPELYRKANEWYNKARRQYKFKDFQDAKESAEKARRYAEQAEYEAIRNNGVRSETPDEASQAKPEPIVSPSPYPYPVPTGTPAEAYEQRGTTGPAPGTSPVPIQVPTP